MHSSLSAAAYQKAGIVGIPPIKVISALNEYGVKIYDLDAIHIRADIEVTVSYIPRVYCAILRTVILNALHLDLDAVYIDVGRGKCDNAFHVAAILEDILSIPVIRTWNEDIKRYGSPVCQSGLPLTDKFQMITQGVQKAAPTLNPPDFSEPTAGFWGVPPRDFSILPLFPDSTHIYGWTRCMENKTPADTELEAYFNPRVPTVFFAQSFCAKTALARHLAGKHPRSLCLDADVQAGSSAKAKIQAFLELSGAMT